jgi:hypothetical protein
MLGFFTQEELKNQKRDIKENFDLSIGMPFSKGNEYPPHLSRPHFPGSAGRKFVLLSHDEPDQPRIVEIAARAVMSICEWRDFRFWSIRSGQE